MLDEILSRLSGLGEKERAQLVKETLKATKTQLWVPNPGPQTDAYFSLADEIFYGGEAGGGKSDLIIGCSVTAHQRSLILRRTNKEASKLFERYLEIIGSRDGWNGQDSVWRLKDGKIIDIGGCQLEDDKQKRKGDPHDLIGFDEISDFTETQYRFIIGWNRSTTKNQRCRVITTGNPPTTPEGLWVIKYWGAWLDPTHPNPAKPGELRWYTTGEEGKDIEVDGPGPHIIDGQSVIAKSRTFIRARLSDNPDLAQTNYQAALAALPRELRDAYRDGRFDVSLKDDPWQLIPTAWVLAAQERWTSQPIHGVPMCAMGVDVAQGGDDQTVIAPRYDGWYAPLIIVPGKLTPGGSDVAGLILKHRRDNAIPIIDMGGGYGGAAYEHLIENGIDAVGYKGAAGSTKRTEDKQLAFANKRSEAYWRFREALDPDQPGGSTIMLPPNRELLADLTAPTFKVTHRGVVVEAKEDVVKRLSRSTDSSDAVVMAWSEGQKAMTHATLWRNQIGGRSGRAPKVVMSRQSTRKH